MRLLSSLGLVVCAMACGPGAWAQSPDHVLRVTDSAGSTGQTVDVRVFIDFATGEELCGLTWGVCSTPGDDSVVDIPCTDTMSCVLGDVIAPGADLAAVNGGAGPDFLQMEGVTGGWFLATLVTFNCGMSFPPLLPADGVELAVASYDLVGPPGSSSTLEFCDGLGDPPAVTEVVALGGAPIVPSTQGGVISVETIFLRGDGDGSGVFDGLVDGLFLLSAQFIPGSPAPSCLDAADVDDDGTFNGLVDALAALSFQFVPGSPPPPPPGVVECGVDPTPDGLDCGATGPCP